ncbi:hypothetical protein VK792_14310 [Mesobacterium sp. TK19101]|uniref:Uncharacterized protein n=1 Tax=Mesobacterium hydrothermale TaxID=3111907 RepID=A0ABU6HJB0_9RHOB|nr:hypothetical protein [Mesobacterium sp. TK19101]MEC3862462.1 hypothetical protein [Mesobacterium sp. TK19101]
MIDSDEMGKRVARLEKLLAQKFGLGEGDLARRAAKAGRRLPRSVRNDIALVAETAQTAGNPKLALQMPDKKVARAFERAEAHLSAIDVKDRRKDQVLKTLGVLSFNLIVLFIALIVLLRWRGFI